MKSPKRRVSKVGAALVLVAIIGVSALGSLPAGAAGNGPLSKELLSRPGRGWTALPRKTVDKTVSSVQAAESTAAKSTGLGTALVAGNMWRSPHRQVLEVFLVSFVGKPLEATMISGIKVAAKLAAETLCEGATTDPPTSLRSITSPPAYLSVCKRDHGKQIEGVAFERKNVLGLVASTVGKSQLLLLARRQYRDVPARGFRETPGTAATTQ